MRQPVSFGRGRAAPLIIAVLACLAAAGARAEEPVGPEKPVVVVNTPAQPLPVIGTVTGTVAVSNTPDVRVVNTPAVTVANVPGVTITNVPTVNSSQSGPWVVGLAGPAQVQGTVQAAQSGPWTIGLDESANSVRLHPGGNVVRIDPQAPLPVRVETPPLEPFQADLLDDAPVVVPTGRRLVVETVTVVAFGREDTGFYQAFLRTTAGGRTTQHLIATVIHPFVNDGEVTDRYYQGSVAVRIYADPGTEVAYVAAQSGATHEQHVSISGHLVPAGE